MEERAAEFLRGQGFRVLERNFKGRRGELDLVVEQGPWVVFVEVRYRRSSDFGTPEETVDRAKRRKVCLAALEFAQLNHLTARPLRFDVVCLVGGEGKLRIEHLPGAFEAEWPPGRMSLL